MFGYSKNTDGVVSTYSGLDVKEKGGLLDDLISRRKGELVMRCLAVSPEIDRDAFIEKLLETDQGCAVIAEQWRINSIGEKTRKSIDRAFLSGGYMMYPSI